jgi:hypothetical protein
MHSEQILQEGAVRRRGVAAPALALVMGAAGCLAPEPVDREAFLMAVPADAGLGRVELVASEDPELQRRWLAPEASFGASAPATRDLALLLAGLGVLLEASMPLDTRAPEPALILGEVAVIEAGDELLQAP